MQKHQMYCGQPAFWNKLREHNISLVKGLTQGLITFPEKQGHRESSPWEYSLDACIATMFKKNIMR